MHLEVRIRQCTGKGLSENCQRSAFRTFFPCVNPNVKRTVSFNLCPAANFMLITLSSGNPFFESDLDCVRVFSRMFSCSAFHLCKARLVSLIVRHFWIAVYFIYLYRSVFLLCAAEAENCPKDPLCFGYALGIERQRTGSGVSKRGKT
jgi:hypothetical protein